MKHNQNLLLMTDVYKIGHMMQYKPGTTKVYSYLCARSTKKSDHALFFGLQPYLKLLETKITASDALEFFEYWESILGVKPSFEVQNKIIELVNLGYLPLEIKAVPEGTVIDNKNVLATITNTIDGFHWVVGFFESLLLKVWAPTTVATLSHKYKKLATEYAAKTSDSEFLVPFLVHDFGYRGVSSEQSAEILGAAHLVSFTGSDNIPGIKFAKQNYAAEGFIAGSVPASEHSVMCSYGEDGEIDAFRQMLKLNPTGLVSIVSDTYNFWRTMDQHAETLKEEILARDGKLVFRPDSGDPLKILCGERFKKFESLEKAIGYMEDDVQDEAHLACEGSHNQGESYYTKFVEVDNKFYKLIYEVDYNRHDKTYYYVDEIKLKTSEEIIPTPEQLGAVRILDRKFGSTVNSKGFKELNPKVGLIYGDGMYFERVKAIYDTLTEMGFATTNVVLGIGGLLLQQHNRDDLGFAFKATFAVINGQEVELFKDPITDPGKRSHKGLMMLGKENGKFYTADQVSEKKEQSGFLETVFLNGKVTKFQTFAEIRERAKV